MRLPIDYKILIEHYGRGQFCDLLFVRSPFGVDTECCDLLAQAQDLLDSERRIRAEFPENYPYPLFPEPGGLLPWGGTGNGDVLCWLTNGEPDNWPVVVWRGGTYEVHKAGVGGFIEGWLSGRLACRLFPAEFTSTAQWFDPPRDLLHVYVRLTEGEQAYSQRLRILRETLEPTLDRRSIMCDDGTRQDHFAATKARWRVTYETTYGHQIRVAFPPADEDHARDMILLAAERMGCQPISASLIDGTTVWKL